MNAGAGCTKGRYAWSDTHILLSASVNYCLLNFVVIGTKPNLGTKPNGLVECLTWPLCSFFYLRPGFNTCNVIPTLPQDWLWQQEDRMSDVDGVSGSVSRVSFLSALCATGQLTPSCLFLELKSKHKILFHGLENYT